VKAAVVEGYGGIDRLQVVEVPDPAPGEGEVVVEVRAAGLNYSDVLQREGTYYRGPLPPFIPGVEAAGVVVDRGRGTVRPAVGEAVMVVSDRGLHAERAVVPAIRCTPLLPTLDFQRGAGFLVTYLTAYHALAQIAHAREGETLVVHAGGGGLGTAAVQIGKALGLTVVALASTEEKRKRLRDLGADVAVDYAELESAVADRTSGAGAGLVLATVGGRVLQRSIVSLAPSGRLLLAGAIGETPGIDLTRLIQDSKQILGVHLRGLLRAEPLRREAMERLESWLSEGRIRVQVGHEMPLDGIGAAHELLESRMSFGKIVLVPSK
jgi:NADPH2:quinone reductase